MLKIDANIEEKMTCGFINDMRKLVILNHSKILKVAL